MVNTKTIEAGDIIAAVFEVLDTPKYADMPTPMKLLLPLIAMDLERELGLISDDEEEDK